MNTAKGNSAPDVYIASSHFKRMVVVRLKHKVDLLDGLKTAVKQEQIKNAAILAGIGSLTSFHVHQVNNTVFPLEEIFVREEGPYDLLNVNGYVIEGRVHAHITFSDDQRSLGGHLESGTTIFTFAAVTLGVFDEGTSLERLDDLNWR